MKITFQLLVSALLMLTFLCCNTPEHSENILPPIPEGAEAVSLLGKSLEASASDAKNQAQYELAKVRYESEPENVDNIIWYGRRAGYIEHYREAIRVYSEGIKRFPEDARLYRHRGHRYISIRELDRAIQDLEKAEELVKGKPDEIEPDGLPNARNIPISSLQTNICYHLGLAYYLKQDWENAIRVYQHCLSISRNDDNLVSVIHWLYMALRRTKKKEEANQLLERIDADMNIIENFDYHRLCLFYKGEMEMEQLLRPESSSASNDAVIYGIANWYAYNGDLQKAKETFRAMVKKESWYSFGVIAAEAELAQAEQ